MKIKKSMHGSKHYFTFPITDALGKLQNGEIILLKEQLEQK